MYVLGLTGSLAMGKTTVADMFRKSGVPVFDADASVHDLFNTSKRLRSALSAEFPGSVANGQVDREKLSKMVFGKPDRLTRLELIVHPFVFRRAHKFFKNHRARKSPLVVLDLPLLFEIKAEDICDGVLVVSAPPEIQNKRARARPNFSENDFLERLARQMPDAEKRKRADFIFDTSVSIEKTRSEVKKLIAKLTP